MKGIGLRLYLTSDLLVKLVSACANRFKHFVRIGRTQPAGEFHQVDIRILDAFERHNIEDESYPVLVTREMVGELFDLLGIFPREEQKMLTIAQTEQELRFVIEKLISIERIAAGIRYPVSSEWVVSHAPLDQIRQIAELARHKVDLLLSVAKLK